MPHELALVQSPLFYSSPNASNSLPTIVASSGFSADMKAKADLGHQAVIDFIGGVAPVTAFLFEPNGAASVYADMESPMCDDFLAGDYCPFDRLVSDATSGGGSYMRGNSPKTCCNSHVHLAHVGLYYLTTASDTSAFVAERAVHEYTHAVQGKYSDMTPQWLMEGGAVQMECLLAHKMPNPTGYADCMKYGGGRGGVIPNTRAYYASAYGRVNGLAKGEDRCCDGTCGTGDTDATFTAGGTSGSYLYYDAGAVAIAWAINKAGVTSGSSGRARPGRRLLGAIVPCAGYDYATAFSSDCPVDAGWKKAFASFTGHADITAFYTEFDAWAKTATENDILAFRDPTPASCCKPTRLSTSRRRISSPGIQAAETCDFQSAVSAAGVQSAVKLAARTVAAILATFAAMR